MKHDKKAITIFIIIELSFIFLFIWLFIVQVWNHDKLKSRSEKIVCRKKNILPSRGMILDSNGNILAMSIKDYILFIDPSIVKNPQDIILKLKRYNINIRENIFNINSSYLPVAENINENIKTEIEALKLKGVGFTPKYRRYYPEGRLACHVLGVLGNDNNGLEGIEYSFNSYLSGEDISLKKYIDGKGREISGIIEEGEFRQGANIVLTIDRNIQFIAEQELEEVYNKTRAKKATIIIQDPMTGEILALANRPNYDPANFEKTLSYLKNYAINEVYEPGSTFKSITAAAALSENLVNLSEMIWCENGEYNIYGHTINDHDKRGMISFNEVMQYSSNIGFAKIGLRLGRERLYNYIRQFGFRSKTGIELPGESRGILEMPSKWSGLSLPIISFGQGIAVTPLQLINAYSAIANGGELLKPRIIKEIRDHNGQLIFKEERHVIRTVISPKVAQDLKIMLYNVIENGTGVLAKVPNYYAAGKTGTAQKKDSATNKYSTSCYVSSFCGFVPLSKPCVTILVIIDEPKNNYWASYVAAPVFSKVASKIMVYLKIPPDRCPIYNIASKKRY